MTLAVPDLFAIHSGEAWIAAQTMQDLVLTEGLEVDTPDDAKGDGSTAAISCGQVRTG
jgi:hypothetical protein